MLTFVDAVQQENLDLYKLKGKTFYTVLAPTSARQYSQTTFLGDYCEHSWTDEKGSKHSCACKCELGNGMITAT